MLLAHARLLKATASPLQQLLRIHFTQKLDWDRCSKINILVYSLLEKLENKITPKKQNYNGKNYQV